MNKSPDDILTELLVINCQGGDTKALNLLAKKWHPKLLRQAYHLTRDKEAALDVVQESWQGIIKGIKKLKDPAVFPAWAYRIVRYKSSDWIRKLQRNRKLNEVEKNEIKEDEPESDDTEDKLNILGRALKKLPNEQRVILDLFYLEKQSVKAISVILGLPAGTVKSRLFYAREHLKKIFKQIEK